MSRPRVLVVDDHHELAQLLASALEAQGSDVHVAQDGHEALEAVAGERFDAALVDLLLPDMLGTEVLDALQDCDPPVPALAMSGVFRGDRYHRDAVQTHGARDFFEKPFNTQQVVWRILELTGRISTEADDFEDFHLEETDAVEASAPPRTSPPPLPAPSQPPTRIDPDLPYEPALSALDEPMQLDAPTGEILAGDEPLFDAGRKWKRDHGDGLAEAAAAALEAAARAEQPAPSAPSTAESTPAPAESTPAPAESTPAPAESTPAPAESTPAPAESTPAPAESTPAPASTESASLAESGRRHEPTFVGADERAASGPAAGPGRSRRRMGFVEDLIPVDASPAPRAPDETGRRDASIATARTPSRAEPARDAARPEPRGDLASTNVPRLLAALHQARFTGALKLLRGPTSKIVHLREGRPVFATSNHPDDGLLAFGVRSGALRPEDAETARNLAREEQRRLGELLVDLELLDRAGVRRLVAEQVRDVVWSTFGWRDGAFAMLRDPAADRKPRVLDTGTGRLVIDGLSRLPLEFLRREAPDAMVLAPRPAPVVSLEDLELQGAEAMVVAAADGTKTVADLLTLAEGDERSVRGLLAALRAFDALGPKEQVEASSRRVGFVL